MSICDWLPPDFGAVGQYAEIEARRLAAEGVEVTLVGLSSSADETKDEKLGKGSLRTERLLVRPYERANLRQRAIWTARTNGRLLRRAWRHARAADEILFTGSPPFFLHWIVPANLLLRKRLVYRITDFHPECLIAELGRTPLALRFFLYWTLFLRRRVHQFEVLGEDQKRRLIEIGIRPERIVLRRDESPVSISPTTEPLELPEELRGEVVLLYSGNFGVAHDDATFIEGYSQHHSRDARDPGQTSKVVLWLNATGAKADRVEAELRARGLPVHRSRPVALAELGRLLVTPRAHLITLRNEFVGYVLPSKVYGCIASGRGVLFVGSAASDVDLLCSERMGGGREQAGAIYRRVDVGDAAGVARALDELASGARGALAPDALR
ncbi:MAG: glycosyltransferase [Thermoanaerobaculia bacterium]